MSVPKRSSADVVAVAELIDGLQQRAYAAEVEVERLREARDRLLDAYDQSGLTDLGWFVPYVEALRDA
jgi:ribosomal 50S subunit-associated protein YjgA (DUF615 family)